MGGGGGGGWSGVEWPGEAGASESEAVSVPGPVFPRSLVPRVRR